MPSTDFLETPRPYGVAPVGLFGFSGVSTADGELRTGEVGTDPFGEPGGETSPPEAAREAIS